MFISFPTPNPVQNQTGMLSFPLKNCKHLKAEQSKCNQLSTEHGYRELDPAEKTIPAVLLLPYLSGYV